MTSIGLFAIWGGVSRVEKRSQKNVNSFANILFFFLRILYVIPIDLGKCSKRRNFLYFVQGFHYFFVFVIVIIVFVYFPPNTQNTKEYYNQRATKVEVFIKNKEIMWFVKRRAGNLGQSNFTKQLFFVHNIVAQSWVLFPAGNNYVTSSRFLYKI